MKLKEDSIPTDGKGKPELSQYTDSAEYYVRMYEQYLASASLPGDTPQDAQLAFRRRAHATWGLIAKGSAAVPHALTMLRSDAAEAREDGAAILAGIGQDRDAIEQVLQALASETDPTARDSLILTLGALKSRRAIPALASLIRDETTDADTRWTAVQSLGQIVRRRFLRQPQPVQAALEWLDRHETRNA